MPLVQVLATGGTIAAAVPAIAWRAVEVRVDAVAGIAELFTNGISRGTATGAFSGLASRHVRLGVTVKASAATGCARSSGLPAAPPRC